MGCKDCKSEITGIKCEVENCEYHSTDNRCYADCIKVGPTKAESKNDTVCETFKSKQID